MIARAPGKLVVSGAYSVLEGAPAIVTAVDRFARADAARPPPMTTPEVEAAIALGSLARGCSFDASELRAGPAGADKKLGLGSSAAILVATLAATYATDEGWDHVDDGLRARVHRAAAAAHRRAQGGGSGVDVAAATFGGTLRFVRGADVEGEPTLGAWSWPAGTVVTVWTSGRAAVTRDLLARVTSFRGASARAYGELVGEAGRLADDAVAARDVPALVAALTGQTRALAALGDAAGAPIVDAETATLGELATAQGASFGPSGAGGGDVCLYVGDHAPPSDWRNRATVLGFAQVPLSLDAPGVQLLTGAS